jgi:hypothetical protein
MCLPTSPCAWFGSRFGHFERVFPSDETKIKSGVALCLEDTSISTFLPIADYPVMFICLNKPICHEEGYVIYQFTCDLFSRSPNPESIEPTTNLRELPWEPGASTGCTAAKALAVLDSVATGASEV